MTYKYTEEEAKIKWNKIADEWNQWCDLDKDEKDDLMINGKNGDVKI